MQHHVDFHRIEVPWNRLCNYLIDYMDSGKQSQFCDECNEQVMLDPIMATWDCGPFPVIFREAGGYFGSWDGREGHLYNEALACNSVLLPEMLRLIKGD